MTVDELIGETIEHHEKMTAGPWLCGEFFRHRWSVQTPLINGEADVIANEVVPEDGDGIAFLRNHAATLAKIAERAINGLRRIEQRSGMVDARMVDARIVLADIERIAAGTPAS